MKYSCLQLSQVRLGPWMYDVLEELFQNRLLKYFWKRLLYMIGWDDGLV